MEPENNKDIRNNLNINALPPPIAEGNENDFTYSIHLSRLLRRFVRIVVPDNEQLTFSDVELLDDVMRFGNLSKIAKKKGVSESTLSVRVRKIIDQLENRVTVLEKAKPAVQAQERIDELEKQLQGTQKQLMEAQKYIRRQTIFAAREKSMAIEAHLREHKHN